MIDDKRYQTFYDAVRSALGSALRSLSVQRVPPGEVLLRSVDAWYGNGTRSTADSARTIRTDGTDRDNRWSGPRPKGPGLAALYLSRHIDALSNEVFHYAKKDPKFDDAYNRDLRERWRADSRERLKQTRTFRFKTSTSFALADLSSASSTGTAFLRQLDQHPAIKAALAATYHCSVLDACNAFNDYSFSRALGHAVSDELPFVQGLTVVTARDEYAKIGESGENLVLFGANGKLFSSLIPLSEFSYDVDARGKLTQTVTQLSSP